MKLWKGPKHFNILLAKACIIAGSIGLVIELIFKDWGGTLLAGIIMVGGSALYGFQALAWKQYEQRKKDRNKTNKTADSNS